MEDNIETVFTNYTNELLTISIHPDTFVKDVIYHYTSPQGLFGILSTGILRATNYSYLNDSSEVKYGTDIVEGVLEDYAKEITTSFDRDFLNLLKESFRSKVTLSDLYVSCFSKNGNQLSQWRAYGSSHGSFSIGLDVEDFDYVIRENDRLANVIYKVERQKQIVRRKIKDALGFLNTIPSNLLNGDAEEVVNLPVLVPF